MEKESSGQRPVEANGTGGQGSHRAVAPSDVGDYLKSSFAKLIILMIGNWKYADHAGLPYDYITSFLLL
jgi:hypothetical protein